MKVKFIEASQNAERGFNWGKFAVMRFDEEWSWRSAIDLTSSSLLRSCGWGSNHLWVLDLQTGEGAFLSPGGSAHADLDKHKVWVCPMFEPFLEWLYGQDLADLDALPTLVELPDAPGAFAGYRRPGLLATPKGETKTLPCERCGAPIEGVPMNATIAGHSHDCTAPHLQQKESGA